MSEIVQELIDAATADTDLLLKNAELGDNASTSRNVDFMLYSSSKETAELVAGFVTDFRYGSPKIVPVDDSFQLKITVTMPTTQEVLLCISGFMVCIATIYGLKYDGWESDLCVNH